MGPSMPGYGKSISPGKFFNLFFIACLLRVEVGMTSLLLRIITASCFRFCRRALWRSGDRWDQWKTKLHHQAVFLVLSNKKGLRIFTCEGRQHFSKCLLLWYNLILLPPKVLWVIVRWPNKLFQKGKKHSGKFNLLFRCPKRTDSHAAIYSCWITPDFAAHLEWRIDCSLKVAICFGDHHSHRLHTDNLKGLTKKKTTPHWKPRLFIGLQGRRKPLACLFNSSRILKPWTVMKCIQ